MLVLGYRSFLPSMKRLVFCLPLFLFSGTAFSQLKYDNVWTMGYGKVGPSQIGYPFGGIIMDFNDTPPSFTLQTYIFDRPKAAISDKNGNLVGYTNGCMIVNRNHQLMLNGDTLSPGSVFNEFCEDGDYPSWQPAIFLPTPASDSLYYLFHIRGDDYTWNPINLMYSVIDASGDNGNGMVLTKNNVIFSDSLYLGTYVTATRHANGKDWWLVNPRHFSNNIHVSLCTKDKVTYQGMQDFDHLNMEIDSFPWSSQTAFSADGSKYFRNSHNSLLMLDFDRCTGKLSNPVRLDWDSIPFGGGGVVTSPNSRFLYLSSGGTVQQYDLLATDLVASMQVVAVYDGTLAPFPANFFQMMPGPDGKIYIISSHDNNILHVIHNPDSLGLACNVEQHAIILPARQGYFIPNFANYNLGPLDSPCDTTGGVGTVSQNSKSKVLQIAPNPTTGLTEITLPNNLGGLLTVYNVSGQKVNTRSFLAETNKLSLDFTQKPAGPYWIVVSDDTGKLVVTGKFSVLH